MTVGSVPKMAIEIDDQKQQHNKLNGLKHF